MGKHTYVGKSLDEIPEPSSILLDHNLRKSSKGDVSSSTSPTVRGQGLSGPGQGQNFGKFGQQA
jgi:hypothetical protein